MGGGGGGGGGKGVRSVILTGTNQTRIISDIQMIPVAKSLIIRGTPTNSSKSTDYLGDHYNFIKSARGKSSEFPGLTSPRKETREIKGKSLTPM